MSESEYNRRAKRDLPGLIRKGIEAVEEFFSDRDLEAINELVDKPKPEPDPAKLGPDSQ